MNSKQSLAVCFVTLIAAAVAYTATYPRWHENPPPISENDRLTTPGPGAQRTVGSSSLTATLPVISSARTWSKLTASQRALLAPFSREWDNFSDSCKTKWLKIAAKYSKMPVAAQQRLHQRMVEWGSMSTEQRRVARENFQLSKSVPSQQRQKAWAAYQKLPEAQKKKLEASEQRKHRPSVVSAPLTGKTEVKDLNALRGANHAAAKPAATSAALPQAASTSAAARPSHPL